MGNSVDCQVSSSRPMALSAADSGYFRSLLQFLMSVERMGMSGVWAWRVYDLGLRQQQLQQLMIRFKWCEFVGFDFTLYPPHVDLKCRSYAWKPIIIAEALVSWTAPVFWFDSATILHTTLDHPLSVVRKNGIWALRSRSALVDKCDLRVLDALDVPLFVRHLPERAAGALGFDPAHAAAVQLVLDWKRNALVREIIVPDNAANYHKQDQAVFNCLLLKAAFEGRITLNSDEVDISSARPQKDVTTRNIVAPRLPLWADPLLRFYFLAYKKTDQWGHVWNAFSDRTLDGARRWWKEHFSVKVYDCKTGTTRAIASPAYGYYADPFLWQHDNSTWLFVEEFQYAADKGRLVVMELTSALEPALPRPVTSTQFFGDFDCHVSFPHVFAMNGLICMIPETCERKSVDLYVCEQWPDRWRAERRLLFNIDAVDTMTVFSNGLWWLITSVRVGAENRHLEIYFTDDLVNGTLHAHPINNSRLYADLPHGSGRNAGYLARSADGRIKRLMQKNDHHYGQGIAMMEIVALNTEHFEEHSVDKIQELPIVTETFPTHHASRSGDLVAYDTRDRVR